MKLDRRSLLAWIPFFGAAAPAIAKEIARTSELPVTTHAMGSVGDHTHTLTIPNPIVGEMRTMWRPRVIYGAIDQHPMHIREAEAFQAVFDGTNWLDVMSPAGSRFMANLLCDWPTTYHAARHFPRQMIDPKSIDGTMPTRLPKTWRT